VFVNAGTYFLVTRFFLLQDAAWALAFAVIMVNLK
jgi:hypothetical protein